MNKTVQHRTGTISLIGDIYHFQINEGVEIELQDAIELVEIGTRLTKGLRVGALVDGRSGYTDTNEARKYFAEKTAQQQFLAVAVITRALPQRLLVNFYINVNQPNVPTKMFTDEESAMKWLREQLDGEKK
ncbi:MAG: hypothetical protein HY064_02065 [Bacteroidetes bacterium]|nr:hypothetical protein [Bacteroidota bacterium]